MQENGENSSKKILNDMMENYIAHFFKLGNSSAVVDDSFMPICKYIFQQFDCRPPKFESFNISPIEYEHNDVKVIAFSGGIVSMACALRYKDAGQNIALFHVAYSKEDVSGVKEFSEMLNVPLYICYPDFYSSSSSPVDSAIIIKEAVNYILREGYSPTLIYGYFDLASMYNNDKNKACHCKEFIHCYESFIKKLLPDFTIVNLIPNYHIAWDELLTHKPYIRLLNVTDNQDILVLENAKMDFKMAEAVSSIYMQNFKKLSQMYTRKKNRKGTVIDIWNEYFYYRIESSKFYKELMELPS